jgi:hypothetical protein
MRRPLELVIAQIIGKTLNSKVEWQQLNPESQQMLLQHARNIIEGLPSEGYRIIESIHQ